MHECNPVTSPVRTAPALWRGAAPSVNWERRSAAAARNWSASWKAAARRETASPRTPGNYFQQAPKNPTQVALSTLEPRGTGPPAPFSFGGWRTNQKTKTKEGIGSVLLLVKWCDSWSCVCTWNDGGSFCWHVPVLLSNHTGLPFCPLIGSVQCPASPHGSVWLSATVRTTVWKRHSQTKVKLLREKDLSCLGQWWKCNIGRKILRRNS